ncbi:MAG: hypothetical protein HY074_10135 [Deltaproteobacteria bacterium]|nr:hypothetical protein [Deltaproteobacteria bacterium]
MSATANPHFDVQQQALTSLKRIHQICFALECFQVIGSLLVLTMGYWMRPLHLYASMIYFFTAVFAHIVVYYVLQAIAKNVRDAYVSNPRAVQEWIVLGTGRIAKKLLPFILLHSAILLALIGSSGVWGFSGGGPRPPLHHVGAWIAAAAGLLCLVRIAYVLRENTNYLTAFVTTTGITREPAELVEH